MDRKYILLGLFFSTLLLTGSTSAQQFQYIETSLTDETEMSIDTLLGMDKISELKSNIHYRKSDDEKPSVQIPDDVFKPIREKAGILEDREFSDKLVNWDAPNICHHPLYFEDIGLERYSQNTGWLQPAISTAHFFGRTITLPLHAAVKRPFSCEFPLGLYRPGNCNPYLHYSFPW